MSRNRGSEPGCVGHRERRDGIGKQAARPWSSVSRSASTAALSWSRHACSNAHSKRPTPARCVEAYYLQCTPERKLRQRQLTDDGNVGISLRDLRKASSGNCADSGECLKSTQSCCSLPSIAMPAHSPEKALRSLEVLPPFSKPRYVPSRDDAVSKSRWRGRGARSPASC